MISSLKYKFELAPRRALYITGNRATVYHWYRGRLGTAFSFDTSEIGLGNFERYINEHPDEPVYVLIDLNEEEYKQDLIPHARGNDRKSLISRRKARLFRNPVYSHAIAQGRESEGRRDDRYLFTCVSESDSTAPWINRLTEREVPIAGIYSVPLITHLLLDVLHQVNGPSLIVSLEKGAGLRQSFFKDKAFKFSRLVKAPRYGTEPYAPFISDEIQKMLRYLRSTRDITNDSLVHIYILGDERLCADVEQVCKSRGGIVYKPVSLPELSRKIGCKLDFPDPHAERLYVFLLLANKPGNIYASSQESRHFQIRRMRNGIYATSLLALIGSLVWGGLMFMDGVTFKQQAVSADNKIRFYSDRYAMARETLLEVPVQPEALKTAIEAARTLESYKTSPQDLLVALSNALDRHQEIQIDALRWTQSTNPDRNFDEQSRNRTQTRSTNLAAGVEDDFDFYQIAELQGHISPFDGNYRRALASVEQFVETIKAQQNIIATEILAQPLDISPSANLQGDAESITAEASYRIRVVLGMNHESE